MNEYNEYNEMLLKGLIEVKPVNFAAVAWAMIQVGTRDYHPEIRPIKEKPAGEAVLDNKTSRRDYCERRIQEIGR